MCMHVHDKLLLCILQADAEARQPQRIASREWTAQDHPLFHSSRSVAQPYDPLTALVLRGVDQNASSGQVL